jgi:hypothetical protein
MMLDRAVAYLLKELFRSAEQYYRLVFVACRLDHLTLRSDVSMLS